MKIVTIIENKKAKNLSKQHGLSLYIEYNDKKYLFDAGPNNNKLIHNASELEIDLKDIDYSVLSHAHNDHADGYRAFLEINKKAKLYLNKNAKYQYFVKLGIFNKYIGITKSIFTEFSDRLEFIESNYKIDSGVYIIPHKNKIPYNISGKQYLYKKTNNELKIDDFLHEQSLVFETEKGLVILSSCMHAGVLYIVDEIKNYFPDKKIHMLVGGFHLMGVLGINTKRLHKNEILKIGEKLNSYDIPFIYTGHCTGLPAYKILKQKLGNKLHYLATGTIIEI